MVNNLGATTTMELNIVAYDTINHLTQKGMEVERVVVGSFMTALDMVGFSLTLWRLSPEVASFELEYFDQEVKSPAWPHVGKHTGRLNSNEKFIQAPTAPVGDSFTRPEDISASGKALELAIQAATQSLIDAESELTEWDTKVGDGDCGTTLKTGAEAIQSDLNKSYPLNSPSSTLHAIAGSVSRNVGGTSGGKS